MPPFPALRRACAGLLLGALLLPAVAALAGEAEVRALDRLFTEPAEEAWFAPVFLAQLPVDRVDDVLAEVRAGLGAYERVREADGAYQVVFEDGYVPATIHLDGSGRIDGLFFRPPVPGTDAAFEPAAGPVADRLAWLFSPALAEAGFAPSFLDQVPFGRVRSIVEQYTTQLGAFERVLAGAGAYRLVFADGYAPARIQLDGEGRIAMLLLQTPVTTAASLTAAIARFETLAGTAAALVRRGGERLAAHQADRPLAIGSAFKLSVLAALRARIEAGEASWADVIRLDAQRRSLPSGTLQDWPDGAPVTLYSAAARMISESDNTATDLLIDYLGRATVEAHAPARNRPFPKTREFFVLKDPARRALGEAFLAAGPARRTALLEETASLPLPEDPSAFLAVQLPAIEWFYTVEELCALIEPLVELPLTGINDGGPPNAGRWARIAFKGGSEAGVMNLTYGLEAPDGTRYCVSATQNDDAPLDEVKFVGLVHGLVDQLP